MWKIFRRDPLEKMDRRKTRAEKKHIREREKAWRRRSRAEAWRSFQKRFNIFMADPFAKRKRSFGDRSHHRFVWRIFGGDPQEKQDRIRMQTEKKHVRAKEKAWRRRRRAQAWSDFQKRFNKFIADPFAKRALTSDELEMRRFRIHAKRERKLDRLKWLAKFRKNPWNTLFPPRPKSPGGGYYDAYGLTKLERREMAMHKRKQFLENFRKLATTPDLRRKFGFAYLHSTAYFILAFLLIYIIYQGITIAVASSYNIPIIWYYYQLKFPLYTYSPLYTRQALIVIFAMGPLLSLMLAFVFLRMYFTENTIAKRFKLFYLWGFICGANMFFGAYIVGVFTRTEFIYTSAWLFMSRTFDAEEIIFTAISTVMLIIIGRIVTPLFLLSSSSVTLIKPEFRLFFILSQVILPWLTGSLVLFLITLPNYYFPLILKTITPGLIMIPSLFLYNSLQYENIHQSGVIQRNYFRWGIVISVVVLLFFYRVILSFGLQVS